MKGFPVISVDYCYSEAQNCTARTLHMSKRETNYSDKEFREVTGEEKRRQEKATLCAVGSPIKTSTLCGPTGLQNMHLEWETFSGLAKSCPRGFPVTV